MVRYKIEWIEITRTGYAQTFEQGKYVRHRDRRGRFVSSRAFELSKTHWGEPTADVERALLKEARTDILDVEDWKDEDVGLEAGRVKSP